MINETINQTVNALDKLTSLQGINIPDASLMSLALIIFIIVAYTALKVLKNTIIVAIIAASFPVVLKVAFGFQIQITPEILMFYAVSGVSMYLLYEVLALLYRTSKIFFALIGIVIFPITALIKIIAWAVGARTPAKKKEDKKGESEEKEDKKDKPVKKKSRKKD